MMGVLHDGCFAILKALWLLASSSAMRLTESANQIIIQRCQSHLVFATTFLLFLLTFEALVHLRLNDGRSADDIPSRCV